MPQLLHPLQTEASSSQLSERIQSERKGTLIRCLYTPSRPFFLLQAVGMRYATAEEDEKEKKTDDAATLSRPSSLQGELVLPVTTPRLLFWEPSLCLRYSTSFSRKYQSSFGRNIESRRLRRANGAHAHAGTRTI